MITCKHDISRTCSCNNCKRIVPVILKYNLISIKRNGKKRTRITLDLCEDCSNALSTLHSNVMENGTSFKYVEDEFKELEEKTQMEDKRLNLCSTCKFCFADCMAAKEGIDFKFGTGIGNDNIYECKIYENESEEI